MTISEMTNEELNSCLAIEVRGWIVDSYVATGRLGLAWYCDEEMNDIVAVKNWNPTEDLNQAVECAEKLQSDGYYFEILGHIASPQFRKAGNYDVGVWCPIDKPRIGSGEHESLPRALSEAVLMAKRETK